MKYTLVSPLDDALASRMKDKFSNKSSHNADVIAAEPLVNTGTAETSHKVEWLADIPEPEGSETPIATYEFIWHYDHNPVLVPWEITQKYSESDSKELVHFYKIQEPSTKNSDEADSSDETANDDTHSPTHRAEVRLFRHNEKRVTFGCRFHESFETLKDVRFIRSESINMNGFRWPFFEDSRRLEDLDLRLRDERDRNGYYYIEFTVRRKSHRDSSDMPHLTVLGRRVVDGGALLEFSEEEALRLVRRKTPEPYKIEGIPGMDVGEIKETSDRGDSTVTEEDVESDETPETEGWWEQGIV